MVRTRRNHWVIAALSVGAAACHAQSNIDAPGSSDGGSPADASPSASAWDALPDETGATGHPTSPASGQVGTPCACVEAAAAPVLAPAPGTYEAAFNVTLSSVTPGAMIRFTLDGTPPNHRSEVYHAPIAVSGAVIVTAYAEAPGYRDSPVTSGFYNICACYPVTAPSASPTSGTYFNDLIASLNCSTANATICYTLDESFPLCDPSTAQCGGSAIPYDAANGVAVTWRQTTDARRRVVVRAMACKAGALNSQEMPMAAYTLSVADPTLTESSTVALGSSVIAGTLTRGTPPPFEQPARLHYTLDGTTPTCTSSPSIVTPPGSSEMASGMLGPLTTTTTVRVIGCKEGYNASNVVSRTYGVE